MFDEMNDGPFGQIGQFEMPQMPQLNVPQPKPKKGGMFGGGGMNPVLAAVLGGLGDYLLQRNGMQPIHAPQMAAKRRQQYEEQQYQRQRSDGMQDWMAKRQYEAQHPSAPQPTELERIIAAAGVQPGTPEYVETMKKMLSVKTNPMVMTPYGPMPYSAVSGGGQQQAQPLTDDDILKATGGAGRPVPQTFPGY